MLGRVIQVGTKGQLVKSKVFCFIEILTSGIVNLLVFKISEDALQVYDKMGHGICEALLYSLLHTLNFCSELYQFHLRSFSSYCWAATEDLTYVRRTSRAKLLGEKGTSDAALRRVGTCGLFLLLWN